MWITINEFPNYEINDFGEIKNKTTGMLKKHTLGKNGYYIVTLYKNNQGKRLYIHRLIAIYFIDNPNDLPTVNHKDGLKTNNELSNLEWASYGENNKHAYEKGLKKVSVNMMNHAKRLNILSKKANPYGTNGRPVIAYGLVTEEFPNVKLAAERYGLHRCSVDRVLKGKRASAKGIVFKYKEEQTI